MRPMLLIFFVVGTAACNGVLENPTAANKNDVCANVSECVPDGCCPIGCDASSDSDCSATCGNGRVDEKEMCDGNCPTQCDDSNACTDEVLVGNSANCTATCVTTAVTECVGGDGCCAQGCTESNDSDCVASCGNGRIEGNELCDGDCPIDCDDGSACTIDTMEGSANGCNAVCRYRSIGTCQGGDGCCPSGCSINEDSDCQPDCTDAQSWPGDWAAFEAQVVEGLNQVRAAGANCGQFGSFAPAGPLQANDQLSQAARCHSNDMAGNNFFSHSGSNGSNFSQRIQLAGFQGSPAGENIAAGQQSPAGAVSGWVASDGHCRNLMNPNANRVGIGFVTRPGTQWTNYWTMVTGAQ